MTPEERDAKAQRIGEEVPVALEVVVSAYVDVLSAASEREIAFLKGAMWSLTMVAAEGDSELAARLRDAAIEREQEKRRG